jgi:hypothetical protein
MKVGAWTTQGGKANNDNQMFFMFGSVVGFTNTVAANGTAWPGMTAVKFNPPGTTYATTVDGYQSIPSWYQVGTDITIDGYISSSSYHTLANVQAGRGDPCKLIGLTINQIAAGVYDSGLYRLPTNTENVIYANPTHVAGNGWIVGTTPTAGIRIGSDSTTFLPASGFRDPSNGSAAHIGSIGHYWSSTPQSFSTGHTISFRDGYAYPNDNYYASSGSPIRCVKQ